MSFEVDREMSVLATEIARRTGVSEEEAVRQALRERRLRLEARPRRRRRPRERGELLRFMETEIWPQVPNELRGRPPMTKAEREEILGYGPEGF